MSCSSAREMDGKGRCSHSNRFGRMTQKADHPSPQLRRVGSISREERKRPPDLESPHFPSQSGIPTWSAPRHQSRPGRHRIQNVPRCHRWRAHQGLRRLVEESARREAPRNAARPAIPIQRRIAKTLDDCASPTTQQSPFR